MPVGESAGMDIGDVIEGMAFEGDAFTPASIVCDTRDGELAVVVAQSGDDLDVRWFSSPLDVHHGKAADFASVAGRPIVSVGFVADSLENDEAHMAKAVAQVGKLVDVLPAELLDLIRTTGH